MSANRKPLIRSTTWQRLIWFLELNPAFAAALFLIVLLATVSNSGRPSFQLRLDRVVDISGWVSRTPETRDDSVYFELTPSSLIQGGQIVPHSERIAVWVSSSQDRPEDFFAPPLQYGDLLKTTGYLRESAFYAVPGVEDYRWLAWLQGTPFRLQLKSPLQLERLGQRNWIGNLTAPFFHYLRRFENHSREVLGDQSLRFLLGVFLGRKRSLGEPERELIRSLGLLHLFVVSGFHISLLVFFLHSACRLLGRFGFLVTIVGIWVYILAIGFPLAAVGAGIIASVAYLMIANGLQRNLLNGVGISALIIAGVSPRCVFAASFHLSYICLCAIGLLALPSMKYIRAIQLGIEDLWISSLLLGRERHLILRRRIRFYLESVLRFTPHSRILFLKKPLAWAISYLLMLLLCSVCIQLLLFPVALHYTNRWSLTQGLSNLLLMPIFSLLVALCFLFFLFFWTPLGSLIAWALNHWTNLCHSLILFLGSFSPVTFLPHPQFWEICVCLFLTLLAALTLDGRAKALALLPPICLVLVLRVPAFDPDKLIVTTLDVGQGESIHLHYPSGEDALIDTGGLPYPVQGNFVGERLISRYLWHLRIQDLHYVLITHPDSDHRKGYTFIKKAFPISTLIYSESRPDYDEPSKQVFAGDEFSLAGVRHAILYPTAEELQHLTGNHASIVLQLTYGNFSMLFTGDIEYQGEQSLIPRLAPVTALKVAHHGSNTSTSALFLSATRPRLALVSAGRSNYFGHPSPLVLERLEKHGARVLSTSKAGSLRLLTDGLSWEVQRYSIEDECFLNVFGPERLTTHSAAN